jgi:2-polyprenyl-3-methyl-5-hydroxy-6-metoxy-1,4-benzoquinol methylase
MQSAPGVHEAVLAILPDAARGMLLDLGCGVGELTRQIVGLGRFTVTAVDQSSAPEINGLIHFQRNLEDDWGAKGSYDVVLSTEVIEHLRDPFRFLQRAAGAVRPGGCLIISTPNIEGAASRLWFLLHGRFLNFTDVDLEESGHIHPLAFWQIRLILEQAGLHIESVVTTRYTPVVRSLRDRLFALACRLVVRVLRLPLPGNILVLRARKPA